MKKILLFLIFSACNIASVTIMFAQSGEPDFERRMHIHGGGSVLHSISVSNVDSITFSLNELPRDSSYLVNDVAFTMKAVAGGTFTMGCAGEQGGDCNSNESPLHDVTLSDYHIGETVITQGLWEAVMGVNPSYFQSSTNSAYAGRDNNPVESVSWEDIVGTDSSAEGYTVKGITYYQNGFCYKLSQLVGGGKQFRLPTEAEWEYAARGGNVADAQTKYSGSDSINDVAWYRQNIPSQSANDSGYGTQSVKGKQANALGLYDMSGNVYEWCSDLWGLYSGGETSNPTGPTTGSNNRVHRGGGWNTNARGNRLNDCRVSYRAGRAPDDRDYGIGFRLAL